MTLKTVVFILALVELYVKLFWAQIHAIAD
jgi:hypothetical protein